MGLFDFLSSKRVNKDIEKWEKRKKNSNKISSVKEPIKKINSSSKKSATDKWVEEGGDMTEMMREIGEELIAKGKVRVISEKEKKEVNEKVYDKLTKNQIKDRQIYATLRAYHDLFQIKVDFKVNAKLADHMGPNEIKALIFFSQSEFKRLSKDHDTDSEEFLFVWSKEENVFECLKTFNKRQVKDFFRKLFIIAAIDTELKPQELAFLKTLYCGINDVNENEGLKKITNMYKRWKKPIEELKQAMDKSMSDRLDMLRKLG